MSETSRIDAYAHGYEDGRRDVAARFTWEDVDMLHRLWDYSWDRAVGPNEEAAVRAEIGALDNLADRIAALLPPR